MAESVLSKQFCVRFDDSAIHTGTRLCFDAASLQDRFVCGNDVNSIMVRRAYWTSDDGFLHPLYCPTTQIQHLTMVSQDK